MSESNELTPLSRALGKIPSGLFVVSSKLSGEDTAMLASWVMQAGFEPATISIAVKTGRALETALEENGSFCVNVLRKANTSLIGRYAKGMEPGSETFEGVKLKRSEKGNGILEEAVAYLDCEVLAKADAGDHVVYTAKVVESELLNDDDPSVHVRKNGLRY